MSDETLGRQPPKFCKECAHYAYTSQGVCTHPETRTFTGRGLRYTTWARQIGPCGSEGELFKPKPEEEPKE